MAQRGKVALRSFIAAAVLLVAAIVLLIPAAVVSFYPGPKPLPQDIVPGSDARVESMVPMLKVFRASTGMIEEMNLDDYLIGVVAGEMPARFEPEALRAQAVAARTYALRRCRIYGGNGCPKNQAADICTDPNCCQAFLGEDELRQRWGIFSYPEYRLKIAEAVAATQGLIITYNHELIDPVYHASCGGLGTEAVEAVWGNPVPYLVPVECCCGTENKHVAVETTFSLAELEQQLGGKITLLASGGIDLEVLERTAGGRVHRFRAGDVSLTGPDVRQRLGLNSTGFSWRLAEAGKVVFITHGKGHGVGMCQYGANRLAEQGYDFRAILEHYYTGTQVEPPPGMSPDG